MDLAYNLLSRSEQILLDLQGMRQREVGIRNAIESLHAEQEDMAQEREDLLQELTDVRADEAEEREASLADQPGDDDATGYDNDYSREGESSAVILAEMEEGR